LRSPLTSIRGYAQFMMQKPDMGPDQLLQFLKIIISQSDQLGNLINDLMDVVSIEAGKLRVEKAPTVFHDVLRVVASRMQPLADQKKVAFVLSEEIPDLPPLALDRRRIDQVLTNLISNAFKHTPEGGRVTISDQRDGKMFRVEIADNGEGIPKEALGRVFDQFFQVESHASKKEGLGLGLTIAREIVHAHGGAIGVESEGTGHGAKFWFTLPLPAEGTA
jgi:two-component system sensor histidine kinase ResE